MRLVADEVQPQPAANPSRCARPRRRPTTTQMNTAHLQMLNDVYNMLNTPNITLSPDKIASYRELLKQGHALLLKGGSVEVIDVEVLREAYTSAKMNNEKVCCATAARANRRRFPTSVNRLPLPLSHFC
jgi:hypothetical protein